MLLFGKFHLGKIKLNKYMRYINFNGKIVPSGTALVSSDNRGLRYGDGLFETIKFCKNKLVMMNEHMARLWKGMHEMKMKIPEKIEEVTIALLKKNNYKYARVRISVTRGDGGLYDSDNNFQYIIECWPLTTDYKTLNENGLELCVYKEALKICDNFSNLKHNNFLPYFMGALFAQQNKCNDALILNQHHRICDSSNANIFIIVNDTVITPPLNEGCIAGTIRKLLIQLLPELNYNIIQEPISQEMILNADEVFLTNAIYNMRWVSTIGEKKYKHSTTKNIFEKIVQTNPHLFC